MQKVIKMGTEPTLTDSLDVFNNYQLEKLLPSKIKKKKTNSERTSVIRVFIYIYIYALFEGLIS